MYCAKCDSYACYFGGKRPENCPMDLMDVYDEALAQYDGFEREIAVNAGKVEAEGYLNWCRIKEIAEFAKRCGFRKLGLAFCIGLRREARETVSILEKYGFEVFSVVCKTGAIDKEVIGLKREDKISKKDFEAMCNPIAQAEILNRLETDLNIILGLCVGHDTLFIMHSKAPVTCFAVKDRVLAHNPLGAVYARHYFRKRV
ncbi:Uncharacterized metal-binding protein conserved in archaea [Archaeoglobus sulfaticallidus PM70-1]|uniref:Uncharacterized metal-binding protein conserved in archaea n=1 Tax=Archaeoglobus sulfaticallidus PM70-1 TaxID=387631 RepID=N0BBB2_9EURY|nr:DUF1847 domain-containing protein [Archaeoglobus sulfaticallidus]AGK60894.1 Uncharacterized metal-binding protein conserved in archaea [Archaeoglobus sulfaticallidus PM70-1]